MYYRIYYFVWKKEKEGRTYEKHGDCEKSR